MIIDLPKKSTNTAANVPMRGVEPTALPVRDEVSIVEGRMFEFGTNEVVVGRGASGQFEGLTVGNELRSGQNTMARRRRVRIRRRRRRNRNLV